MSKAQAQSQRATQGYYTIDPRQYQQYAAAHAHQQHNASMYGHHLASGGHYAARGDAPPTVSSQQQQAAMPNQPNQGQYATLSRRCRTLEASSFY